MTAKRTDEPADERAELVQQIEEEQHVVELPAREAFSLVWSSPTFLQAGGIAEQVLPEEPAVSPPAAGPTQ